MDGTGRIWPTEERVCAILTARDPLTPIGAFFRRSLGGVLVARLPVGHAVGLPNNLPSTSVLEKKLGHDDGFRSISVLFYTVLHYEIYQDLL